MKDVIRIIRVLVTAKDNRVGNDDEKDECIELNILDDVQASAHDFSLVVIRTVKASVYILFLSFSKGLEQGLLYFEFAVGHARIGNLDVFNRHDVIDDVSLALSKLFRNFCFGIVLEFFLERI